MNKLSFHIIPSAESNDHQVRILIDGEDFLGHDYLGIDPHVFFAQQNISQNGELIIGRCTCGCEGCGDYPVTVAWAEETISWITGMGPDLVFEKGAYLDCIARAAKDHSWEDINRTVERLATNILRDTVTDGKYRFDWASARMKERTITLSYSKDGDQKLFEIPWDGRTEENVIANARQFKLSMGNH